MYINAERQRLGVHAVCGVYHRCWGVAAGAGARVEPACGSAFSVSRLSACVVLTSSWVVDGSAASRCDLCGLSELWSTAGRPPYTDVNPNREVLPIIAVKRTALTLFPRYHSA